VALRHCLILAAALPLALTTGAPQARQAALAFIVTSAGNEGEYSAGDGVCQSTILVPKPTHPGPCTLRAAIDEATADKASVRVTFDIPSAHPAITGNYILPDGSSVDGTTEPGYAPGAPVVQLDQLSLGASSVVRGLVIASGITVSGNDNTIAGNFIGVAPDGEHTLTTDAHPWGIRVNGGDANTIGGTEERDRNVIAGWTIGVYIQETASHRPSGNTIEGNLIGLDADGKKPLGNERGIVITYADGTLVGGTSNKDRNVISGVDLKSGLGGFDYGIVVTSSNGTRIQGNYIGTNEAGTAAVKNTGGGILVDGDSSVTTIGDAMPEPHKACEAPCNLISGNGYGISVMTSTTKGAIATDIASNFIGTDVTGTHAVPNGVGIRNSSSFTVIGGSEKRHRVCDQRCNLISGNLKDGINFYGSGGTHNVVAGNFIGTDLSGERPLPNKRAGVEIDVSSVTVGGARVPAFDDQCDQACNVISGNGTGVSVGLTQHAAVKIEGNVIGLDAKGNAKEGLGNFTGIGAINSTGVVIGGTHGEGNLISNNESDGLDLAGTRSVQVLGNWIGVSGSGEPEGNRRGLHIGEVGKTNGSFGNVIGTSARADIDAGCSGGCNLISSNREGGVWIDGSSGNRVQANYIGVDRRGDAASPNGKFGVLVASVAPDTPVAQAGLLAHETVRNVIGGSRDDGNLISGNKGDGVEIADVKTAAGFGGLAAENFVQGNMIGTDRTGEEAIPNEWGVDVVSGSQERIGGPGSEQRNLISGNERGGILISGQSNKIQRNIVGLTRKGDHALTNHGHQIFLVFGQHNTISKNTLLGPAELALGVAPAARAENDYSGNTITTP